MTVYDRIYGDFPAKNTVFTPYIPLNVLLWPTLLICGWDAYKKEALTLVCHTLACNVCVMCVCNVCVMCV